MGNDPKTVQVWLGLVLVALLSGGCSSERSARQQCGSATPSREHAAGSTMDRNDGQRPAYLSEASARTTGRDGQDTSESAATIHMTNAMRFVPAEVTITAGQSVVWTNASSMVHTVTDDPSLAQNRSHAHLPDGAAPFNSGSIAPGGTFRHVFDVPGTYAYFCIPHETMGMVGQVVVRPQ